MPVHRNVIKQVCYVTSLLSSVVKSSSAARMVRLATVIFAAAHPYIAPLKQTIHYYVIYRLSINS
jgi:hypothetical protein